MVEQFANNASSTLNEAINNVTTTIVVTNGSSFPSTGNFRLFIGTDPVTAEIVLVTARSGNTLTVIRAQENTTAQSWTGGTTVTHILTAGAVYTLQQTLRGKSLNSSLETVGATQDGYALTWINSDGYWAPRPGSPFNISGNQLNTTRTLSIDENGTFSSSHGDGLSKLYVNGAILASSFSLDNNSSISTSGSDSIIKSDGYVKCQVGTSFNVQQGSDLLSFSSATSGFKIDINASTIGRIYQAGAWAIGNATNNDTSSEAQAGLTGPLINIASASGTATSAANQALLYNLSGSLRLQAHSDVRFEVGTNLAGYFDSARVLRIGKNPTSTSTISATTFPRANNDTLYSCSTSEESFWGNFNQSASSLSAIGTYNTAAGGASSNGLTLFAMGASGWMSAYALNGVIEQSGSATSALVFGKVLGDGSSRGVTGRIWQSGAWNIGEATQNDTSSEAHAGLTGPLLNISQISGGTQTSTTNQALLYNSAGTISLQGHVGQAFIANTTTVASTSTTKFITNVGRRISTNVRTADYLITASDHVIIIGSLSTSITITLPASPTAGDTYIIKDQAGGAATNNIIVSGNGANIDGAVSYTINTNYQSITVVFANSTWSII